MNSNELLSTAMIIKLGAIFNFLRQNYSLRHSQQSIWSSCFVVQLSKTVCRASHDYCCLDLPFKKIADLRSHAETFNVLEPFDMLEYCLRYDLYLPCGQRY